jgi:hypothetical protein
VTTSANVLARPGVIRQVTWGGSRHPLAGCALCERLRPIVSRGLCGNCRRLCHDDGTLTEFGWTKTERITEFAKARGIRRPDGTYPPVGAAAAAAGVSERTGQRYENELAAAGLAPWRATDENVIRVSRRQVMIR